MARIPKYQQGQLSSQLVGTAGVDASATSALNAVASDAKQVGNSVYTALQDEYVLNRRALQEQETLKRANEKHMQTLYNQSVATATSAAGDTALDALNAKIQQDHPNDMVAAQAAWDEHSKELIEAQTENITDPEQKLMAQTQLHEKLNTQTKSFTSWKSGRMVQISKDNFNKLGDALRLSVNDASLSGTQVLERIQRFGEDQNVQVAGVAAHGLDAGVQLRKAQAEGIKDFLAQVANTGDAKRLDILIHDKRFDQYIPGQEKEQFYSRQRSLVAAVHTQQRIEKDIQDTQDRSAITTTVLQTNPDDLGSLQNSDQALKQRLSDELKKPAEQRSKEIISKLETEIGQVENHIRAYPKKVKQEARQAQQEKRDQQYNIYRSDSAAKTRIQLAGEKGRLQEKLKTVKNQDEALKLIKAYDQKIEANGLMGKNYLDVPGSTANEESERAFINKAYESLKKGGNGGVLGKLRDYTWDAIKYFQNTTPAPGKSSLQTHDQMGTAYKNQMNGLTERYRAKYKKAPDDATLKKMHDYAMNGAFKEVHSGR